LKIVWFVCPAEGYGEDVINVPRLSGLYGHVTCLTCAFPIEEEGEAEGRREGLAFHLNRPRVGRCLVALYEWWNGCVATLTCSNWSMLWC
jgi:hypothetical protein